MWIFSEIKKTKPRLPGFGYRLFYSDTRSGDYGEDVIISRLLISEDLEISGKPDMIYRKRNKYIPIELKSGKIGESNSPHEGDLMQLVAYFMIIEDEFDYKPKQGRLIYSDHMFIVKNTRKQRKKLLSILDEMRDMLETGEQDVSPSFVKCRHCIYRGTLCEYSDNKS